MDSVRWSLKISRETDEALRAHLGRSGARKGDLSRFVQDAVQARLRQSGAARPQSRRLKALGEALREVRARTRGISQARLEKLVAEAVAYARARR